MHRANGAATILNSKISSNPSICLLSEPCTAFHKVSQVPTNRACFANTTLSERPRAAIYVPRTMTCVFLEQLSNKDCSVVLLDTKNGEILLASNCLVSNDTVVQDWLENLIACIDSKHLPVLLSFNCNAHLHLWGPDTNERGKDFQELIIQNNLQVENALTFHAFRRGELISSHIDVTLTKNIVPLHNWRVWNRSFSGSDHHTITWSLPLELTQRPPIRPWLKAKWGVFSKEVSDFEFEYPENLNSKKIDKLVDRWYKVINEALDKDCLKRPPKPSPAEMDWYGSDHRFLKNRAKRKYLAQADGSCPKKRKAYLKAKKAYSRACKKGRREAWRMFIEKTPDKSNMAALFKIAQKRDKRSINTLIKPDNALTAPGVETIQMLTDTHFPAASKGIQNIVHYTSKKVSLDQVKDSHDRITEGLVRKALLQFKPNKAPGPDSLEPLIFRYLPANAIEALTIAFKACIL